jgi:hypothetical protein
MFESGMPKEPILRVNVQPSGQAGFAAEPGGSASQRDEDIQCDFQRGCPLFRPRQAAAKTI